VPSSASIRSFVLLSFESELEVTKPCCLIKLSEAIVMAHTSGYAVDFRGEQGIKSISYEDLLRQHPRFFKNKGLLTSYDVFISHRHIDKQKRSDINGSQENRLIELMYDQLTNCNSIGENGKSIDIFLDTRRIPDAKHFEENFAKALVTSRLFVPMVSRHSMDKMTTFNPITGNDSVLVEWIMALTLRESKKCEIFPILLGTLTDDKAYDLFSEKDPILKKLPNVTPRACIARAKHLLMTNGCSFDEARIDRYTVNGICSELCKIKGCEAFEVQPFETLPQELSRRIKQIVSEKIEQIERAARDAAIVHDIRQQQRSHLTYLCIIFSVSQIISFFSNN